MRGVVVGVLILLVVAGFWYFYGGHSVPAGQVALVRLNAANFGELRSAFNGAADSARIVALLSPT
jgi:hypothetical protein